MVRSNERIVATYISPLCGFISRHNSESRFCMSYRISFYGYDRSKMRSLLGSRDADAIARLHERVDAETGYRDEIIRNACKAIIARAVDEGVPFSDLDAETHVHTWAAWFLAQYEQEIHVTCCGYNWESVPAFRRHAWRYARPHIRAFINALSEGVPIFGQRFADIHAPYYASFSLPKVIGILSGLQELRDSMPSRPTDGSDSDGFAMFLTDLIGYLQQIRDKSMDCWFMTG